VVIRLATAIFDGHKAGISDTSHSCVTDMIYPPGCMLELDSTLVFRLVIAIAIVLGMPFYLSSPTTSHEAAAGVHSTLVNADDHGHSHLDEGESEAAQVASDGHSHKHNPWDHSHETVNGLLKLAEPSLVASRSRIAIGSDQPLHGLTTPFDRPPRPFEIA